MDKKKGAPRTWDRFEVMRRVCEIVSTSERGTAKILKEEPNMPAISTFLEWLAEPSEEGKALADMYAHAKQLQAEVMENLLLEVCDDARNDYMERLNKDGECIGYLTNGEAIQRSKLRVDTRKWLMAKLHPRKYADTVKIGGDDSLPPVQQASTITHSFDDLRLALQKQLGTSTGK